MSEKNSYFSKKIFQLNWWNITKIFWKEQLFFYLLTVFSCLLASIIDENAASGAYGKALNEKNWIPEFKLFNSLIIKDFKKLSYFLFFMATLIIIYCLTVIAHVYYSYVFVGKIKLFLRKKLIKKLFLNHSHDKKVAINTFSKDIERFTESVFFFPNQIFYLTLSTIISLWLIKINNKDSGGGKIIWIGLAYTLAVLIVIFVLDYLLYKKDLKFQSILEMQTKKEIEAVNNRDLIIKKGFVEQFEDDYKKIIYRTEKEAKKRNWIFTLSWIIPSFSLITYSDFFFLPFIIGGGKLVFLSLKLFGKIFSGIKKMIERLREYPYYLSAKKRLIHFLTSPERNDIQKNLLIENEKIKSIIFKDVTFSYEKNKPVLEKVNLIFYSGKVNFLKYSNGWGKSTLIGLIFGLYQPDEGQIIINDKYLLNEINLHKWRKKIGYSGHNNLTKDKNKNLSTGQRQLYDFNETLNKKASVLIFDEADNALDENNKRYFFDRINENEDKLVIVVSH